MIAGELCIDVAYLCEVVAEGPPIFSVTTSDESLRDEISLSLMIFLMILALYYFFLFIKVS